jgi:hypothetical protein
MGKREVIRKLRQYKLLVSSHFDVDKLVLFGSYAKGTQKLFTLIAQTLKIITFNQILIIIQILTIL